MYLFCRTLNNKWIIFMKQPSKQSTIGIHVFFINHESTYRNTHAHTLITAIENQFHFIALNTIYNIYTLYIYDNHFYLILSSHSCNYPKHFLVIRIWRKKIIILLLRLELWYFVLLVLWWKKCRWVIILAFPFLMLFF